MGSTYTPNLGIEQPATGAYANTWGVVANRSYAVLDAAIGGSAQITLTGAPGTPQQLVTIPGSDGLQHGLFPLIVWTGAQTTAGAVTIVPVTQQRLFIMRNETAATIQFAQSAGGAQFTLQPGYDAHIYCDGASPNSNVAGAIVNPQYGNVLVTGNLQVNGGLTGNLNVGPLTAASLGLGAPTGVPDPLTINGLGTAGECHIRLVEVNGANYGVLLRSDGNIFYIMSTAAGTPYATWSKIPLNIDLASSAVGVGGSIPNASYGLTAPSMHTGNLFVDAAVFCANVDIVNTLVVDGANTNNGAGLDILFGPGSTEGIGSGRVPGALNLGGLTFFTANVARMYITSGGLVGINVAPDQALTVGGYVHTTAGVVFPDGSVQTTAAVGGGSGSFTSLTVTGTASIGGALTVGGALGVTGLVTVNNNINLTSGHTYQINGVALKQGMSGLTVYIGGLPEFTEPGLSFGAGLGISFSASDLSPGVYGVITITNTSPSDARLKRNVRPLEGGLSVIDRLHVIEAEYNGLGGTRAGERVVGVIAQNLAQVLPGCVVPLPERLHPGDAKKEDILHVDTREILYQLVLAVQQLYERSEASYKRGKAS